MNGKLIHTIRVERNQGGWGATAFPVDPRLQGVGSWSSDRLTAVGRLVEFVLRHTQDYTLSNFVTIDTR